VGWGKRFGMKQQEMENENKTNNPALALKAAGE
jgi:hypothetical protein